MTDYGKTKQTLARHGLAPTKKRGQNFLVNPRTAEAIVRAAAFQATDQVVEVGVGLGALTGFLAAAVGEVTGVEIDSGLIRYHEQQQDLPDNVSLLHGDILRIDFSSLLGQSSSRLKIIANLPYSISNPFIFKLIDNKQLVDQVVVMLQKEVAERLTAAPNTREYGIPSVLLGSCASIKKLLTVRPAEFHPRPKIDSQVIRITFLESEPRACDLPYLQKIVRTAFSNRRKTLLNNLASPIIFDQPGGSRATMRQQAEKLIRAAGLNPEARAETLSIAEFQHLSAVYQDTAAH